MSADSAPNEPTLNWSASDPPQWRVSPALATVKLTGAAALLGLGLLFADGDPVQVALAALATAGLLAWGGRDLLVPVRLRAGAAGVTVTSGFAGQRQLPWAQVERITVTGQSRAGIRGDLLEIDCGDNIYLFSRYDLSADPRDVAAVLRRLRIGSAPSGT